MYIGRKNMILRRWIEEEHYQIFAEFEKLLSEGYFEDWWLQK